MSPNPYSTDEELGMESSSELSDAAQQPDSRTNSFLLLGSQALPPPGPVCAYGAAVPPDRSFRPAHCYVVTVLTTGPADQRNRTQCAPEALSRVCDSLQSSLLNTVLILLRFLELEAVFPSASAHWVCPTLCTSGRLPSWDG